MWWHTRYRKCLYNILVNSSPIINVLIAGFYHISGTAKAIVIKSCTQVDYVQLLRLLMIDYPQWAQSGSRDHFFNFGTTVVILGTGEAKHIKFG